MDNHTDSNPQCIGLPRLNEPAPFFEAVSTHGPVKLEDYQGKYLVLFSHPADFTPVCTTEFIAFSEIQRDLKKMNCELLGLSIDSVYSHIAWVRNIEEKFHVKIEFPVIADLGKEVATAYGMIMPGESNTTTSRCVFVIDGSQIMRAMIYYPFTTGRNTDEILRLVRALQLSDKNGVGTGANWHPEDEVILYPPLTQDLAKERVNDTSVSCKDWYFCKTKLK